MKGFLDFIREQGVVGLAIGFILGAAVSELVNSIVADIINPILALALGEANLSEVTIVLDESKGAVLQVGSLIEVFINFLVVAAVVYFGVKMLKLDKLDKKKEEK